MKTYRIIAGRLSINQTRDETAAALPSSIPEERMAIQASGLEKRFCNDARTYDHTGSRNAIPNVKNVSPCDAAQIINVYI